MEFETRKAFVESKPRELRQFSAHVEMRDGQDTGLNLTGYASVADTPYEVNDMFGSYTETITRGAFAKALSERQDVRLLVNHEGIPIARTKSGTLQLAEDDRGLRVDAPDLDGDSPLVQTIRSAMKRGDLDEMSFAFQATRQEWNEDYTQRTIREVRLFDVSVVTYPANPATSATMRSDTHKVLEQRIGKALSAANVETLQNVLDLIASADQAVDAAQPMLADLLGVPNPDADDSGTDAASERQGRMSLQQAQALALDLHLPA